MENKEILMNSVKWSGHDGLLKRSFGMRNAAISIILMVFMMEMGGCTITHKFGPFLGKVVDAETGEPIGGAVILIGFNTKGGTFGGTVWQFADAVEVLTDAKGEFRLPSKRVTLFRAMSSWDNECSVSIFKPGYGAYPRHSKTFCVPNLERSWFIPENEYITFFLPKLLTIEERRENLFNIETPGGITIDKMPNLRKLEDEERINVGID